MYPGIRPFLSPTAIPIPLSVIPLFSLLFSFLREGLKFSRENTENVSE